MNNLDKNLFDVLNYVIGKWKSFLFISLSFSFLVLIFSLFIDDYYSSEVRLAAADVEDAQSTSSSLISSLPSGIGGLMGENDAVIEAKEIIFSRDFFKRLLAYPHIYKGLLEPNSYEVPADRMDYISLRTNEDIEMDSKFYRAMSRYKKNIEFIDALDSKYYTIRFTHNDPYFAKDITDLIVFELNDRKKEKDIQEAQDAIIFLAEKINNVSNAEVRGSISRLIELQLKREMIASMRDEYLATVIDQPAQPIKKSGPLRDIIFIVSFIISTFLLIPIYAFQFVRK